MNSSLAAVAETEIFANYAHRPNPAAESLKRAQPE